MIKWFKQKILRNISSKFARRLAYQPSAKMQLIVGSLASLTALCQQQMQDGEWDSDEKEVFIDSIVNELLAILEGGL